MVMHGSKTETRRRKRSEAGPTSDSPRPTQEITDEEISEYLAQKARKNALKVAQKLKSDPYLDEKFVWRKKIEQDVYQGVDTDFSLEAEMEKQRERMAEIEKVKSRREEWAIEKAKREEETALLARERARVEFQDWERKDEEFEFDQCVIRSEIRLREGRAKPIDILLKHLDSFDDSFRYIGTDEPYVAVFKGITVKELEELHEDVKFHSNFERETPTHSQYWEAIKTVCDWELARAREKEKIGERGLHCSVKAEVAKVLEGKSNGELEALQNNIQTQMRSGEAKVVEFWETVIQRLGIYKARAYLKELHAKLLRTYREKHWLNKVEDDLELEQNSILVKEKEEESFDDEPTQKDGSYSPTLLHNSDDEEAINPEEDEANLERKRKAISCLNDGIKLDSEVYTRHEKYLPRKPKYLNRVQTGYEWNKYNRTHYDSDNPPPKTVQGYKFDIFYPDLIDKKKAPTYVIEKDGESTETCIIRFSAGPPYEDIGFRIANKDWEHSRKKGFKCTFDRGILHLYFNIKRYRYRR